MSKLSNFYRTAPDGNRNQSFFVNGQWLAETDLSRGELDAVLKKIENICGRIRIPGDRYASRTLDLDIICCDGILTDPDEIWSRDYLMICTAELAPDIVFPGKGPIGDLAGARIFDKKSITRLPEFSGEMRGLLNEQ